MLSCIDPDCDRSTWLKVVHALAAPQWSYGYELAETWSRQGDKWDEADFSRVWDDYDPSREDATTVGTLDFIARNHGWRPPHERMTVDRVIGAGLKHVDLSDIAIASVEKPTFVIEDIIPRSEVTLFSAHGGAGKTAVALVLAAHVSSGRKWGPLQVAPGRVLFVSLEEPGRNIRYRLSRILGEYQLPESDLQANLTVVDGTESGSLVVERYVDGVREIIATKTFEQIRELATEVDLVVIDNASDAFDGDENNRRQVRTFIKQLTQLVRGHDGALLLLAHIDKAAARNGSKGDSYSGSTAWHNSARSRIALIKNDKSGQLELHHEKLNLGKRRESPISVHWSAGGVPVPNIGGVNHAAIQRAEEASIDVGVLAALVAANTAGININTAESGPVQAFDKLKSFDELPADIRNAASRDGRRMVRESLTRLQRAGKAVSESYKDGNRHSKTRWKPIGCASAPVCASTAPVVLEEA